MAQIDSPFPQIPPPPPKLFPPVQIHIIFHCFSPSLFWEDSNINFLNSNAILVLTFAVRKYAWIQFIFSTNDTMSVSFYTYYAQVG